MYSFKKRSLKAISFGSTQNPSFQDYADNIDTIEFLINI